MEIEKVCTCCGKTFIAGRSDRKYCSRTCKDVSFRSRHGIKANYNPEPFSKECIVCGKQFYTRREATNTCSHECAVAYHCDSKRTTKYGKKYKRKKPITKECIICGKPFDTNQEHQKTCGSENCKKENKKRTDFEYKQKNKRKKPKRIIVYETRECAECGEPFVIDSVLNNKCCSKECMRKRNNRMRDKRIPKEQKVDHISLKRLFKRDKGICYICGCQCDWDSKNYSDNGNEYPGDLYPTIEHVVPICEGGLDSWDNVRLACWKCNHAKGINKIDVDPISHEFAVSCKPTPNAKKTAQYTLDGVLVKIWDSTRAIEKAHPEWKSKHIQNVCRKAETKTGNAYGYHWEYINDKHE